MDRRTDIAKSTSATHEFHLPPEPASARDRPERRKTMMRPAKAGQGPRRQTLFGLGPVNTTGAAATGVSFSQFQERGVTHTGCLLATSDDEMGKTGPVPSGCRENGAILRCRPRRWTRHSRRPPPRLAPFSPATLSTPVVLTGPRASAGPHRAAAQPPDRDPEWARAASRQDRAAATACAAASGRAAPRCRQRSLPR